MNKPTVFSLTALQLALLAVHSADNSRPEALDRRYWDSLYPVPRPAGTANVTD